MVKPAVVTVIATVALWPCVSAKVALHVPDASPVTVNVTLGPAAEAGAIVAIDEHVLVCEKSAVSPVSCARIVAALAAPSPYTLSDAGFTLKTPGGGAVGVGVGVFVGDGDGDVPGDGDVTGDGDAPGDGDALGVLVTATPNDVVLPSVSLTEIVADPMPTAVIVNVPLPVAASTRRADDDAPLDATAATVATAVFDDVAV
jgi:hypothetical protein